MFVAF